MKVYTGYASGLWLPGLMRTLTAAFIAVPVMLHGTATYTLEMEGVPQSNITALEFGQTLTNTPTGPLVLNDLHVVKQADAASPLLLQFLCITQELPAVTFKSVESTPDGTKYYKIRLKDVIVSSYSSSASSAGSPPTEEITFNYTEIEWTYIRTGPDGTGEGASATNWDKPSASGGYLDPDSDGDSIPDSYEVQERLKPLSDDADEDSDDDGMSNEDEFNAGTLAGDRDSIFKVTGLIRPTAGNVLYTLTFNSVSGRTYRVYAAASLDTGFQPVRTITATDPVTSVDLTLPQFRAFVKVIVQPL